MNYKDNIFRFVYVCLAAVMPLSESVAEPFQPDGTTTFATAENPVMWADYPDPDVIRVGDWFYMMSTTMHLMPGAPVMRSKDLVSWELVSYLFDRLEDTPKYDMKDGTVYGRGQWATSLRWHDGQFYALFSPNDAPYRSYVYTTKDPAKGWTLHSRMNHFHDASLFFDDDGRVYVFSGTGRLTELKPDLTGVKEGGVDMTLNVRDEEENGLLEGSRVIKKDGKYYFMWSEGGWGGPDYSVAYAISDSPFGPFKRVAKILQQDPSVATSAGHHSLLHVPGTDDYYIVYHRRPLNDNARDHRVTCIDKMTFDKDGFINPVKMTFEGVPAQKIKKSKKK